MHLLVVNRHAQRCGGAEVIADRVARHLDRAGVRVTLASGTASAANYGAAGDERQIFAHQSLVLPALLADRDRHGWRTRLAQRAEFAKLRAQRFDAALVHNLSNTRGLRAVLDLAPTVRWVHDSDLTCASQLRVLRDQRICTARLGTQCLALAQEVGCRRLLPGQARRNARRVRRRLAALALHARCARLITACEHLRDELVAHGIAPEHVFTLHFPPPPSAALQARAQALASAPQSEYLLAGGRLVNAKGFGVLLRALARARLPSQARLVIAGEGPARASLERETQALGLSERVVFTGWLDEDRFAECLAGARFLVVPSIVAEPYAVIGTEAQAMGRAVIASAVGGLGEWLAHERTGLLVPPGDEVALAQAIERLWLDPVLCERFGSEARSHWAALPTAAEASERVLQLLREVSAT